MSRRLARNPRLLRDAGRGRALTAAALAAEVEDLLLPGQARQLADCVTKTTYSAKCVAQTAATALSWTGIDVRPYQCDWCSEWHLTHRRSA